MIKLRGAIAAVKNPKQITDKFQLQEFYVDTSSYNNMTGEKYENYAKIQNVNNKVDVTDLEQGDVVDIECYLNGRFYKNRNGEPGFMQNLNVKSIAKAKNTAGEAIKIPLEQMITIETPE